MPSLFLSYRRADSPDTVKLIHERLKKRLPRWEIFYDHESLPLGEQFPDRLRAKVTSATAVLVIIGPKWLEILRERRNVPIDHVRVEVQLALEAGASVIPVLVGNAAMLTDGDLADFADLQPLLKRNGQPVRPDPDFTSDLERIVSFLKPLDSDISVGTVLDEKYTLTAEIGHGGMGVVYAAQQTYPVQRAVAIKLIKPGMDSKEILARFDAERQALAVMDHPNISKVLDAGVTANGRPYFAMEYVKGVPITQYCDEKKLTPQERLNLFIPVCNAVQHAHQKGIIHRDLKPSNVLVEVIDGKAVPKVIDFGLAKALGQKLTDKTLYTALDARVGTLEYSAPEQAAGRSFDIDTRSDIYSLGILLYELLTGSPPFTHEDLLKVGEEEMRRVIKEVEPAKPSKKLSSSGALPAIAANRHLEPNKLTRLVQGDLDWIVMKCLEKENSRRYETANQLGQELQRFLANEPVQAGPPSARYRAKKFLRRNSGVVIATTLVFLMLVAGILGTSIGFVRADWARDDAEKAKGKAEKRLEQITRANNILLTVFEELAKDNPGGTNLTPDREEAMKWVNQLEKSVDEFLSQIPNSEFSDMGHQERLHRALAMSIIVFQNIYDSPQKRIERIEKMRTEKAAHLTKDTTYSMALTTGLAEAYLNVGQSEKAIPLFRSVVDYEKAALPEFHPGRMRNLRGLAKAYELAKEPENAVPWHEKHLEVNNANRPPSDPATIRATVALARCYQAAMMTDKAISLFEATVVANKAKGGLDNFSMHEVLERLTDLYRETKRFDKAISLLELRITIETEAFGDTNETRNLALTYMQAKKPSNAIPLYADLRRKHIGHFATVLAAIGLDLLQYDQFAAAEPMLRECVDIRGKSQPDSWDTFNVQSMLGISLLGQKKHKDAEPLLKAGYEGMRQREKQIPPDAKVRLTEALERLVQLYDATGNATEADRYRNELAARKAAEKAPAK